MFCAWDDVMLVSISDDHLGFFFGCHVIVINQLHVETEPSKM